MIPELATTAATFGAVFLKGFQHKNVIHNRYKWIALTSYLMSAADVVVIGLVAKYGWSLAFWNGTGAAMGMLLAVWLHNRFVAPPDS